MGLTELNSAHHQDFHPGVSRRSVSLSLAPPREVWIFSLWPPSLFKASTDKTSFWCHLILNLTLLPQSSKFKDPMITLAHLDNLGNSLTWSQWISNLNSISYLNSSFTCNVTSSEVWELRCKYIMEATVLSSSLIIIYWGFFPEIETTVYTAVTGPLLSSPSGKRGQGTYANGIILAMVITVSN